MSSPEQLKGQSRRRQIQITRDLANRYNLELADENQLQDLGVSAFRGANVREGALGRFLKAVTRKRVPKGSYLLLESLDRFSRQNPLESLHLLFGIICEGIVVCTKDKKFEWPDVKQEDLMHCVMELCRSNHESEQKAEWISHAWADRRKEARESCKPIKGPCPAWLRLSRDETRYELIPERAATVRLIFAESVNGIGGHALERRLNEKKIPSISKGGRAWRRSYIEKILTNKAVIGEYQPHKLLDGKRYPEGNPIKNYFPAVIDEKLFYRAQQCRAERLGKRRGRKGKYLTNLFTGLAVCAYCGAPMTLENKGPPPKGGRYLACSAAKRRLGCISTGWPYHQFEKSFLTFVREIQLSKAINPPSCEEDTNELLMQTLLGREREKNEQIAKYLRLFETAPQVNYADVATRLCELKEERLRLQKEIATLRAEALSHEDAVFNESFEELKPLIEELQSPTAVGDPYGQRSRAAERIRSVVAKLRVGAAGTSPIMKRETTRIKISSMDAATKRLLLEGLNDMKDERFFIVHFKNGTSKQVNLSRNDPLAYISITDTE